MITSLFFCLSYDLLYKIFSHSKLVYLFISPENCIVVLDVGMTFVDPSKSVV